jgi:hypothetical protein
MSLLRIIKYPIMSDQNMGWSDTMSKHREIFGLD